MLRRKDFSRVYENGTRVNSSSFSVIYAGRDESIPVQAPGPRIGFTTPRALGKAVIRNRLRRRLREAIRLELPTFGAPVDLVFHPRRSILAADFLRLREEVRKVFRRCANS